MINELAKHKRGDTWNGMVFTYKNNGVAVNLTGYTVIARFRKTPIGFVEFEFKTSDNTITIPIGTDGKIYFASRKMDVNAGKYIFDVEFTSPSGVVLSTNNLYWDIVQDIT